MSFTATISEENSFGTLRVPDPFVEKFGHNIPRNIKIICNGGMMWKALYDSGRQKIMGLEDFMKIHKVKQMYTLLLDYLGDGYFNVQIYNIYGVEVYMYHCHWNMENPDAELKLSEYVLGLNKLEDEKARSLFFSTAYGSAYGCYLRYYELKNRIFSDTVEDTNDIGNDSDESIMNMGAFIDDGEESDSDDGIEEADDIILGDFFATLSKSNVDSHCHGVYISKDLDEFISHWNFGQIVFLVRNGLRWHIGINVTNGRKRFSAGWSKFVDNNGLNENDIVRFSLRGDGVTFNVEVVVD
ncbi:hypothetical protein POM88_006470 [Heracleum sosnowskyi]|uniref:TF-B3 domain-containing protein n=1 Tax=Heracleum sosnowskyi TaxID=360622 RepID=A0AAD8J2N3_9APIA|nr:hypothetical protein POM88_006470 [Heracleum sosnowskyi]